MTHDGFPGGKLSWVMFHAALTAVDVDVVVTVDVDVVVAMVVEVAMVVVGVESGSGCGWSGGCGMWEGLWSGL